MKDKNISSALTRCSVLAISYSLLIFLLPASKQSTTIYNISATKYHIALFLITIPSLIVWYAAFYGYAKLKIYAQKLGKSADSHDFLNLARGCAWLAWSLPLPSIIAIILNAVTNSHPDFKPAAIIISNYAALLIPLVAILTISFASQGMLRHNTRISSRLRHTTILSLAYITAIIMYCLLTFHRFDPHSWTSTHNPYYLPVWLMVLTVMVPYTYAWYIGLVAVRELNTFSRHSAGILYRQPLKLLAWGLAAVVVSSIAFQYIGSVEPRVGHLLFNSRLVLQTIFKVIGGVGFLFIALGAQRLQKIEEV